jgi:hypothetical protein
MSINSAYTPESLSIALVSGARDLEGLKEACRVLLDRQDRINQEIAKLATQRDETTSADLTALEARVTEVEGDILSIQADITALENDFANLQSYQVLSASAADNATVGPVRFLSIDFTVNAGAGTYTYDLILNGLEGFIVHLVARMPAAAGRVLNVRNETLGGTIVGSFTSTAVARVWTSIFIHNGTNWTKHLLTTL